MIRIYEFDSLKPEEFLNRDIRAEENVNAAVDAILAQVRTGGDAALKRYAAEFDGAALESLTVTEEDVNAAVDKILAEIRVGGDAALKRYTAEFDGAELESLTVTEEELDAAVAATDPAFLQTLELAAANIRAFHEQQVHRNFMLSQQAGVVLGQRYTPIEKVGICVPGNTAAYPSSVLMDAIPAKIAGVREIVMIAIVDYGVGNLFSLSSSLRALGLEAEVTRSADRLEAADRIILPGVGAFGDAKQKLDDTGLVPVLRGEAERKPLLGICLGMQLLFDRGFEYGEHPGLGLIPGEVADLRGDLTDETLKVPHM